MHVAKFKKQNGKLILINEKEKLKYQNYLNKIKENEEVEIVIFEGSNKKLSSKITYIHSYIQKIAIESGDSFDNVKKEVKRQSGLTIKENEQDSEEYFRSFSSCSFDELELVINTCRSIGLDLNLNF